MHAYGTPVLWCFFCRAIVNPTVVQKRVLHEFKQQNIYMKNLKQVKDRVQVKQVRQVKFK